jgi:18S rRNA (guanine1575-N7)-methyltransferase
VAQVTARERTHKRHKGGKGGKGRDWVLKKKDQMRRKGYGQIPTDTKYTGRKRKHLT